MRFYVLLNLKILNFERFSLKKYTDITPDNLYRKLT